MSLNQTSTALTRTVQPVTVTAVTQAELEEYLERKAEAWACNRQRLQLLTQLEAGAWVEPGPLIVRIDCIRRRRLTRKALTPLLGPEEVGSLLDRVEPTLYRELVITRTLRYK